MPSESISISTIGFTKSTAKQFFGRLATSNIRKVIDVRLHNTSQLAGFAKSDDLAFFLERLGGIEYQHLPILAPEEQMLRKYKKEKGDWDTYAAQFMDLMARRKIEEKLDPISLNASCLLCSESTPHHCHRRLVCDYLSLKWGDQLIVEHL